MTIYYIPEEDNNRRIQLTITDEGEVTYEEHEWIPEGEEVVPGWTNGSWKKIDLEEEQT